MKPSEQPNEPQGVPPIDGQPTTDQNTFIDGLEVVSTHDQDQMITPEYSPESTEKPDDSVVTVDTEADADPVIDAAVDDIVIHESDELIEAKDRQLQDVIATVPSSQGLLSRMRGGIAAWWHNKTARTLSLMLVAATLITVMVVPTSRYATLNTAGVRASATIRVADAKNGQPVKNVEVSVAGITGKTNRDGQVTLEGLRLGPTNITIKKRSFAPIEQSTIIGWGSNRYNDPFQLEPVGSRFTFTITNWQSGAGIAKAEVTDGDSVAVADDRGVAVLVVEPTDNDLEVTVRAEGYRSEKVTIASTDTSAKRQSLVPSNPDIFISNRSGRFDLYKRDLDGKNEAILLAANDNENGDVSLLVRQKGDKAAFVSVREGKKNKDGYLLRNLYIIDAQAKSVSKVDGTESEDITLFGWKDDTVVFQKTIAGASAGNPKRNRILAYNLETNKTIELAAANYFNDVKMIDGLVYAAANSGGIPGGSSSTQVVRIAPDGSSRTVLLSQEVWSLYRTDLKTLYALAPDNKWFSQSLGQATMNPASASSRGHRDYVRSPSDAQAAWVDQRDGKGVLLVQNVTNGTEMQIVSQGGLGSPIRWINESQMLVTVKNSQETATYIVDVPTKKLQKVGDITVTRSSGYNWYY